MSQLVFRGALAVILLFGWVTIATAGPPEVPMEIDVGRDDTSQLAVRYGNVGGGLFLSDDGGETYRVMCGEAIDPSISRETTGIVVGPGGVLFTATFSDMWKGAPDGCSWDPVPELSDVWVSDIVHDPDDSQVLYAVTGGGGDDNGIYRYDGADDSWTPMGVFESALIDRLGVVATADGLRFYESLSREQDGDAVYVVRYSDDGGETWVEYPQPVPSGGDGAVKLVDVDPSDPDRILLSIVYKGDPVLNDSVIVNGMAGDPAGNETIAEPATFGGAAFGEGDEVWVGDGEAPLQVLRDGALTEVGDDLRAQCVHYDRPTQTLHLCRLTDFGVVDTETGDYAIGLDLRMADTWLSCDGVDVSAVCQSRLGINGWCGPMHYPDAPICEAYGYPGVSGGGAGAADGEMGDGASGGCGCRVGPRGRAPVARAGLVGLGLLALALVSRSRRRMRSGRGAGSR